MTVSKLIEILVGSLAARTGERVNATPFRRFDIEAFKDQLRKLGYSTTGKVKMTNGRSGIEMQADIYVGPCYYQLLRHLVKDKIRSRRTGNIQLLTHQPVSGYKNEGGLKFGEMERDALIAYGASYLLQDKMVVSSDAYPIIVCQECGSFAISSYHSGEIRCRKCQASRFGKLVIPYSYKLFTHYLYGLGIKTSLVTKIDKEV